MAGITVPSLNRTGASVCAGAGGGAGPGLDRGALPVQPAIRREVGGDRALTVADEGTSSVQCVCALA